MGGEGPYMDHVPDFGGQFRGGYSGRLRREKEMGKEG